MIEWLFTAIDPSRVHDVGFEEAWHGRLMVAAWSLLFPLGILSARFFKITPWQKWPDQLENNTWWYAHQTFQYLGGILILTALWLIWDVSGERSNSFIHHWVGWTTLCLCLVQYMAAWLRGSKGGPTEIKRTGTIRGDHFDMTPRRILFERLHKSVGYICLCSALVASFSGMWMVNGPRWMFVGLILWWAVVVCLFITLQKRGRAFDTYEAIWGPDRELPGNQMKPIGWGIKRLGRPEAGE